MAVPATQIRRGQVIIFNGDPCRIIEFEHRTPGNLRAFIQAKMKNLRNGATLEHRFRAADQIEKADMSTRELAFSYSDGTHYHFMDQKTFEMVELSRDDLGDAARKIEGHLAGALPLFAAGTLEAAVRRAKESASSGDTVLLAPACASFDQFENFEHRGHVFKETVAELARKG